MSKISLKNIIENFVWIVFCVLSYKIIWMLVDYFLPINSSYDFYVILKIVFSFLFFLIISIFAIVLNYYFYGYLIAASILMVSGFLLETNITINGPRWYLLYEYIYQPAPFYAALVAAAFQRRIKNRSAES